MHPIPLELRTGIRSLRRSPGFVATAVLVLALGLGVNTILFNTVNALLWRPLGFPRPEQLVTLRCERPGMDASSHLSIRQAVVLREQVEGLAEVGLAHSNNQYLRSTLDGRTLDLDSLQVNAGYFRALALKPLVGRLFGPEEDLEGDFWSMSKRAQHRAPELRGVLTESTWRSRFGSDPGIVGRVLPLEDGRSLRILGVVSGGATLPFAHRAELLTTLAWMHPDLMADASSSNYFNVLRLKQGVSLAQASGRMNAALRSPDFGFSRFDREKRFWGEPLRAALVPVERLPVLLLAVAAALLLLLICANVASLFLVRILGKTHDTALRMALGATRIQAVRAHFLEALLVCGVGVVLALLINHAARPLVLAFLPELKQVGPELLETGPLLLLFSLIACLLITLAMVWISIVQSRNPRLAASLAQGGMRASARGKTWRRVLISTQVAVIVLLLSMGGLAWRSLFYALQSTDDFTLKAVMAVNFELPRDHAEESAMVRALVDMASALPGTQSLSWSEMIPCGGSYSRTNYSAIKRDETSILYDRQGIGENYFATLRMRLIVGREFTKEEVLHRDPVLILNEAMARIFFPGMDPIGRSVYQGDKAFTVVGVVKDARFKAMDEAPKPMLFRPCEVAHHLVVRTSAAPEVFASTLKHQISAWNAGVRVGNIRPMLSYAEESVLARTHASILVGGFALLGLLVGSVGLYGSLSAQVQQQRRELGIRIALGATGGQIMARTLTQGLGWVLPGALVGMVASLAAAYLVRHLLYGVKPLDGPSFAATFALLLLAVFLACLLPALRAARVDPAETLRSE